MQVSDSILLKGGRVADAGVSFPADVLVIGGVVAAVGEGLAAEDGIPVADVSGCLVTGALADVHVHFREPGNPEKETIRTGSMAAARGGYTAVCAMPNIQPVPDCPESLAIEEDIIGRDAVIDVFPYASITVGRSGKEYVDYEALAPRVAAFSDDGSGVQDPQIMAGAMKRIAATGKIVAAHCEDNSLLRRGYIHDGDYARAHGHRGICSESEWGPIARDIRLAEEAGCRYHVCHISTKESVELIRSAKARGVKVTCETAPHYLTLCDEDLMEDGRFKMNPPLRSSQDRSALLEGLRDGTIDIIATDHAPHTAQQKARGLELSAMGVVGLETAFPVLYTKLVKTGAISPERLLELMSASPRRIFGLPSSEIKVGRKASVSVFDISRPYTIDSAGFASKGRSTPFDGWEVYGGCVLTMHKGKTVFVSDRINNK